MITTCSGVVPSEVGPFRAKQRSRRFSTKGACFIWQNAAAPIGMWPLCAAAFCQGWACFRHEAGSVWSVATQPTVWALSEAHCWTYRVLSVQWRSAKSFRQDQGLHGEPCLQLTSKRARVKRHVETGARLQATWPRVSSWALFGSSAGWWEPWWRMAPRLVVIGSINRWPVGCIFGCWPWLLKTISISHEWMTIYKPISHCQHHQANDSAIQWSFTSHDMPWLAMTLSITNHS